MADTRQSRLIAGVLLAAAVIIATYPGSARILRRIDLMVYDLLLPLQAPGMSEDITVVAIDDRSLETLGRWPWDRQLHAALVDRLSALGARVIGLDILFSERQGNNPAADRELAAAIRAANVVLAVAPSERAAGERISELLPIPDLATVATALGHVDLEVDVDGLCRSTYLRGGLGDARWQALPLAMLSTLPDLFVAGRSIDTSTRSGSGWVRAGERLIPFTRSDQGPRVLSFDDVLEGRVDTAAVADKFVLVGTTASGLGDEIATPGAAKHERMPGVLLNAQILNGLLQEQMIEPLANVPRILLSLALVISISFLVMLVPLRFALVVAALGGLLTIVVAGSLLGVRQVWYAPAAPLAAVLAFGLCWTGWQHRREQELYGQLSKQMDQLARYHQATGLPNYDMLVDQLSDIDSDSAGGLVTSLTVMHINWPGSASIVLDRPISDEVLQAIRDRLLTIGRPGDFIAHLSGDDFALLAKDFPHIDDARRAATFFLEQVQRPLEYDGEPILLVPQIGVSFWPNDTRDPKQLLSNAYTAMFTSRMDDTEPLSLYSATVSEELHVRSQLEQAMVHALERRQFKLFYQPQISAFDGSICGVEALLRWDNPVLGWISPGAFIPVAEHVGLIQPIGAWVVEESCRQLRAWNDAGFDGLRMSINISPRQFLGDRLEKEVERAIELTGVDPACVEMEITESSLMRDMENAVRVMNTLKESGFALAIDDFGTGYSSLSSLRDFPLDRLKIDMTFVREIGKRRDAEEITQTIIAIGRQLGLSLIAEGVETNEQADFLREHGCDEFQGFLFCHPMPAEDITDRLQKSALGVAWY